MIMTVKEDDLLQPAMAKATSIREPGLQKQTVATSTFIIKRPPWAARMDWKIPFQASTEPSS